MTNLDKYAFAFIAFGIFLGILISLLIKTEKQITVIHNGENFTLRTNCNWPGDKFVLIDGCDTLANWEHDGENWNDVK